jgi:hypothetical protein
VEEDTTINWGGLFKAFSDEYSFDQIQKPGAIKALATLPSALQFATFHPKLPLDISTPATLIHSVSEMIV